MGSVLVAHGFSYSAACGIFPNQGLNREESACRVGRWVLNHCATREGLPVPIGGFINTHLYILTTVSIPKWSSIAASGTKDRQTAGTGPLKQLPWSGHFCLLLVLRAWGDPLVISLLCSAGGGRLNSSYEDNSPGLLPFGSFPRLVRCSYPEPSSSRVQPGPWPWAEQSEDAEGAPCVLGKWGQRFGSWNQSDHM